MLLLPEVYLNVLIEFSSVINSSSLLILELL